MAGVGVWVSSWSTGGHSIVTSRQPSTDSGHGQSLLTTTLRAPPSTVTPPSVSAAPAADAAAESPTRFHQKRGIRIAFFLATLSLNSSARDASRTRRSSSASVPGALAPSEERRAAPSEGECLACLPLSPPLPSSSPSPSESDRSTTRERFCNFSFIFFF